MDAGPEAQRSREFVLCGDWNIAHKPIDLKNWKSNQKNSDSLPEERAWLDRLYGEERWVDTFREVNTEPDQYTPGGPIAARPGPRNVGWRIDYQVVSPGLAGAARRAEIYKAQRFSDHAPLVMDYEL